MKMSVKRNEEIVYNQHWFVYIRAEGKRMEASGRFLWVSKLASFCPTKKKPYYYRYCHNHHHYYRNLFILLLCPTGTFWLS